MAKRHYIPITADVPGADSKNTCAFIRKVIRSALAAEGMEAACEVNVLLTDDGFCIIEGNASSGCGIFQMEHGVRNSELGDIYRSYGVIK